MRIAMFTNTYLPHVGGVARSVSAFTRCYREKGHEVLVVAPEFPDQPEEEHDVIRIPAIQKFNGSDFSVALFTPPELAERLDDFNPQVIHAHHPFLLGNEALRAARVRELPLVYTHHTLYEQYTHYVPADSALLRRFVIELATQFGNLSDHVFAPSESIAELLEERGVRSPITALPTGVDYAFFNDSNGKRVREENGIANDAFVIGHVGRLAPEKNLEFLAQAVILFMSEHDNAVFLLAGKGPSESQILDAFSAVGLEDRIVSLGELDHDELRHAYAALDVFAFASKSETQGMVLAEAMAAGAPVVALDASGVREIVNDKHNGRLVEEERVEALAEAIGWVAGLGPEDYRQLRKGADATAREFSMERIAERGLSVYGQLLRRPAPPRRDDERWSQLIERIGAEWDILNGNARALGTAALDQLVEDVWPQGPPEDNDLAR